MGSGSSSTDNSGNTGIQDASTGFHVLEIHAPSAGGAILLLLLLLIGVGIGIAALYRRWIRRKNARHLRRHGQGHPGLDLGASFHRSDSAPPVLQLHHSQLPQLLLQPQQPLGLGRYPLTTQRGPHIVTASRPNDSCVVEMEPVSATSQGSQTISF